MQIGKKAKEQDKYEKTRQRPKDRTNTKRRDKNEKIGQRPKDRTKAKRQVKRTTNRKATSMTVAELTVKNTSKIDSFLKCL